MLSSTRTILLSICYLIAFNAKSMAHDFGLTTDTSTVVFHSETGDLFGTMTLPDKKGKLPLVIFISGSGPTDRDGNNPLIQGKNNCFLQLSDALAKKGIASFRFDKRGVGQSKKAGLKESDLRFEDYVKDVESWIGMFHKDERISKIIIAGHSEGSLIGMLAALNKADKFISISGPGYAIDETLKRQLKNQLTDSLKNQAFMDIDSLKAGYTVKKFPLQLFSLFRPSVQPYLISWMRYDPCVEIGKLNIPVMIVQGDNDIQVLKEDADRLFSCKPDAKFLIIKKMNHVLKEVPKTNQSEHIKTYGDPSLKVSRRLIREMIHFIKN
jgi:pimeloyl-ACP methyl ester carboxylesterase